jgi:hypothetical protein
MIPSRFLPSSMVVFQSETDSPVHNIPILTVLLYILYYNKKCLVIFMPFKEGRQNKVHESQLWL